MCVYIIYVYNCVYTHIFMSLYIWMCIYTYIFIITHISWYKYVCIYHYMGWLRLVGSLRLRVSFAKEPYSTDDILRKKPIILSILLIVATPYISNCVYTHIFISLYIYVCMYHDTYMNVYIHIYLYQYAHICVYMCVYVYICVYMCIYVCICVYISLYGVATMGWLRLVGSLRLMVSFAKEPDTRDDILQKSPIILRSY